MNEQKKPLTELEVQLFGKKERLRIGPVRYVNLRNGQARYVATGSRISKIANYILNT